MGDVSRRALIASGAALSLAGPAWGRMTLTAPIEVHPEGPVIVTIDIAGRPCRFAVSTASTLPSLRTAIVESLGLQQTRVVNVASMGVLGQLVAFRAPAGLTLRGIPLEAREIFANEHIGASHDGVWSAGILTGGITDLDVDRKEIRRHSTEPDRTGFTRVGISSETPWAMGDRMPLVVAEINGRPARLRISTGAQHSIVLSAMYVRRNRLWDAFPRAVPGFTSDGFDSIWPNRTVRAERVMLGGVEIASPTIVLQKPKTGDTGTVDGYLGMEVLRRFLLSFDVERDALWMKPGAGMAAPYNYDRSGMEFRFNETAMLATVRYVMPGGPAERAGIKVGDVLPEIASRGDRERLDTLFSGPPGTVVPLRVQRGGEETRADIVLTELL